MGRLALAAAGIGLAILIAALTRDPARTRSDRPAAPTVPDRTVAREVAEAPPTAAVEPVDAAKPRSRRTVRGIVRDVAGNPVEGAWVELVVADSELKWEPVRTDAEGRYAFENVPSGEPGGVVVSAPELGLRWRGVEDRTKLDIVLVPVRTVRGEVRDADDQPVAGATVAIRYVARDGDMLDKTRTGQSGRFEFGDRELAVQELTVFRSEIEFHFPGRALPALKRRLGPEEEVGVLVLPVCGEASVRGVLVGPEGAPASREAFVRIWRDGDPGFTVKARPDETGAFGFAELDPGRYRLEAHRDGSPTLHLRDIEVGPDGLDLGVLRLPAAAFIRVANGGEEVSVQSIDQRIRYNVNNGSSEELNAGRYLLFAGAPGQVVEIELVEGQTVALEIEPGPTGKAQVEFARDDGGPPGDIVLSAFDHARRRVLEADVEVGTGKRGIELLVGRYLLVAVDSRGREGRVSIDLAAGAVLPVRLLLRRPD